MTTTIRHLLFSLVFLTSSAVWAAHHAETQNNGFNPKEITYLVTMKVNNKSDEAIRNFSAFYQALVEGNEPSTLAWHFYSGPDGKVHLMERYENSMAALQHVKNISPGGIQEKEFGDFTDHFVIEKIAIYGNPSSALVDSLEAIGLPSEFRASIGGYSRR